MVFVPSFESGGVERNAVLFSNSMVENGFEVFVIYCRHSAGQFEKLSSRVKKIKISRFPSIPLIHERLIDGASMCIFAPFSLRRFRRKAIIFGFQSGLIAISIAKISHLKSVVRLSNHFDSAEHEGGLLRRVSEKLKSLLYRNADKVIANSSELAKDYHKVLKTQVSVVYNPINFAAVEEKSRDSEGLESVFYDKNCPVILSVGRLVAQKNYSYLIEVFRLVRNEIRCCLVILGEGEEREQLSKKITDLGLEGDVLLVGYRKNVYAYMANADLFVLSSLYEGMPNVLIEAISTGTYCIANDIKTGPKEILENGNCGALVEPGNKSKFSREIIDYINEPEKYIAKKEHAKNVIRKYSIENTINSYLGILRGFNEF